MSRRSFIADPAATPARLTSRRALPFGLKQPVANQRRIRSLTKLLALSSAIVAVSGGCRAGYRDAYTQKMAGEIRNLEDQLYEADYENQVLRDKLASAEMRASQVVVPRPARSFLGRSLDESGRVIDSRPRRPESVPAPVPLGDPRGNDVAPDGDSSLQSPSLPARPLQDPGNLRSMVPESGLPDDLTPLNDPPSEAVPPGKSDLMVPDVELGEPVPPPADGAAPEPMPNQILLPDSAKRLGTGAPTDPVALRINPTMSGGYKSDDSPPVEGVSLLVEAIDERGNPVRLDQFDIDATLSIVLLDPTKSPSDARLGKWDYSSEQVRELVMRSGQSTGALPSGLQVTIPWTDKGPASGEVIAHVRLASGDTVMQAQGKIATTPTGVAQWTPRAELRR